jgi:hypothetical protein
MSNETKQTAMQMAIAHYKKLSEEGSNQAYVIAKFLEENFLEMEKEQIRKAYCDGEYYKDAKLTTNYYNETYGCKNE